MIFIENVEVTGFRPAIRGMRRSYKSYGKADSYIAEDGMFVLGPNDEELLGKLNTRPASHSKLNRAIHISCDITAPLYFWKQFDTYKIGTVSLSESTMHNVMDKEFELSDFSYEKIFDPIDAEFPINMNAFETYIAHLNLIRQQYLNARTDAEKHAYWYTIIQMLPESYNQTRTIELNYQVAKDIKRDRSGHKLEGEWAEFICWLDTLPYFDIFTKNLRNRYRGE